MPGRLWRRAVHAWPPRRDHGRCRLWHLGGRPPGALHTLLLGSACLHSRSACCVVGGWRASAPADACRPPPPPRSARLRGPRARPASTAAWPRCAPGSTPPWPACFSSSAPPRVSACAWKGAAATLPCPALPCPVLRPRADPLRPPPLACASPAPAVWGDLNVQGFDGQKFVQNAVRGQLLQLLNSPVFQMRSFTGTGSTPVRALPAGSLACPAVLQGCLPCPSPPALPAS